MLLAGGPLSPETYISGGLGVLALILFAETGLLVGFFLPGDTLLLLAGAYTKPGSPHLAFGWTVLACLIGAIVGAQTGFAIGKTAGPRLFDREDGRLFRREHVERTHRLLHRFGEGKAVVAARFVPVVRTFMNPAVGATGMSSRDFAVWNVVGALLWVPLVLLLGRLVGSAFPLDKIVIAVVVVSLLLPVVDHFRRRRRTERV